MELLKIEQVIVGSEMMSTSAETKPEPVNPSLPSYQHDSLQCFQCFITFCNSKAKERHMRKSHREEYKQQLQQQSDRVFTCYVCDRSFSCSEALTQHQASHNGEDKPFRCTYCQDTFRTFSELTSHRRQECTERQYICKDCSMVFRSPARLRTHRIATHPQPQEEEEADDTKTYRCGKCSRGFQTEEELVQHQETFAGKQKCYVKPPLRKRGRPPKKAAEKEMTVNKKSKEEGGAAAEEEGNDKSSTKSRGRPPKEQQAQTELKIPCPEADCDLIFPSVAALRAHKKVHHGPPPPPRKAHPCNECEESYARPEQLKAHVARAHSSTRHNCPTCGKSFGRESNLKAHQKTHTEGEEAEDTDKR
ncbi:zinc finger protein 184-like isoform X1 [Myripristis murdjan]|nr:zinc finger protein 184-like isoform X1 [Myripristis murdjan]XP_029920060.1 zinc finger protein 184-like isoform X1 [Myripristis murdjan]